MAEIKITENNIRELAYRLWQKAGSPLGSQDEFWHRAQVKLETQQTAQQTQPQTESKSSDNLSESQAGNYPPTGDSRNFA